MLPKSRTRLNKRITIHIKIKTMKSFLVALFRPVFASRAIILTVIAGLLYRAACGMQGVDTVDVGFCNTFYQVIFTAPDSNVFNFLYYLTGLIGGAWEALFGHFGLLGFRFLESLMLAGAILMLYFAFAGRMSAKCSVLAVALSFLFPTIVVTFHYDTMTYLLVSASVLCLSRSLSPEDRISLFGKRGGKYLIVSGLMIGLSFFARIVNLSLLVLPLVILFHYARTDSLRTGLTKSCLMLAGIVTGCLVMFAIMACLGHTTFYLGALDEAFYTLGNDEATHSKGEMMVRYAKSTINVISQILAVAALWMVWMRSRRITGRRVRLAVSAVIAATVFVLSFTSQPYLSLLAMCTAVCLYGLVRKPAGAHERSQTQNDGNMLLTVYMLVATYVLPLGSDIGIQGIFNWCAGLMVFPAVCCARHMKGKRMLLGAYVCVFVAAVLKSGYRAYGDTEPRYACTYMIQPGRLNVFTDRDHAAMLQRAIAAVGQYSGGNRLLLMASQHAELYYATNTEPYLGHVQNVIYTGERLKWRLDERAAHFGRYPMVMYVKEPVVTPEQTIIMEWMAGHGYRKVFDDGVTSLYTTVQPYDQ